MTYKQANPPVKGKIVPVVFETVRQIGGGDLNAIWKNIVTVGAKPSLAQVERCLDNGVRRGYFIFSYSSGRKVFSVASADYQKSVVGKRKVQRKKRVTRKVNRQEAVKKLRQQQAAHARAVLAEKRAQESKKAKKAHPPSAEKPLDRKMVLYSGTEIKWYLVAGLAGAGWGFLTGFALAVWMVAA
jgi:hypothetical protein